MAGVSVRWRGKTCATGQPRPQALPRRSRVLYSSGFPSRPVNSRSEQERVRRWHDDVICTGDDESRRGDHAETSIGIEALQGHEVSEAGMRRGRMAQGALRQPIEKILLCLKKLWAKHHRPLPTHGLFQRHVRWMDKLCQYLQTPGTPADHHTRYSPRRVVGPSAAAGGQALVRSSRP